MIEEFATWKLTDPDIACLMDCFKHELLNPQYPTKKIREAAKDLFAVLEDLSPLPKNPDVKSIWLRIPRGSIEDYGNYEEELEYGTVSSYEEFCEIWETDYPYDFMWHELTVVKETDYFGASLDNRLFLNAATRVEPSAYFHREEETVILLGLLTEAARESMSLLREGTYNEIVQRDLPYEHRTGVMKRSWEWECFPEAKEAVWEDMTEEVFLVFRELIEKGENDRSRIQSLPGMTGNDFLRACAIGYKACGYDGCDLSLVEQYLMHADGRDEGLTGKGHGLHEGEGIDLDSPDAWKEWYFDSNRFGGHPWEVCRGGNSTHVSLYVSSTFSIIDHMAAGEMITREEAKKREMESGFYYYVSGNAWNRAAETVKFYVSLHKAGLPVLIGDGKEILLRYLGEDYIGIVPHSVFPKYCDSLFPDKYGKILDFTHVYSDEIEKLKDGIEWFPIEEAKLKKD